MTRGHSILSDLTNLTDTDVRDLGPHDRDALRELFCDDLFTFAWVIGGCDIMNPTLHGQFCAWIQRWGSPGYERLMTQIPRDHLKSTIGTVINALWQISREPHLPLAIFNATTDNTTQWMRAIRSIIEGSRIYQACFADLIPPGKFIGDTRTTPRSWKWSDYEIDLHGRRMGEPECSISGMGLGGAATGHHWPKIIIDDPIGQKEFDSEAEMNTAKSWVRNHIYLMRPSEQGWCYVNCTPWTYNDTSVQFTQDFGYRLYRRAALELPDGTPSIDGDPIYPERFSRQVLLREYARDPFTFNSQRQCTPQPGEETSFRTDWLQTANLLVDEHGDPWISYVGAPRIHDGMPSPSLVRLSDTSRALFIDPANPDPRKQSNEKHSRHGIVVEAIDPWGRRTVLESHASRTDPKTLIDTIFSLSAKWGASTAYVEEVLFSRVYQYWIMDLQRPGNEYAHQYLIPIGAPTKGRSKHERIVSLIPGMRRLDYYFVRPLTGQLYQEITEYPNSNTLDLIDALAYDRLLTHFPDGGGGDDDTWQPAYPSTRDPLTGY